jgi:hypothetical protein
MPADSEGAEVHEASGAATSGASSRAATGGASLADGVAHRTADHGMAPTCEKPWESKRARGSMGVR